MNLPRVALGILLTAGSVVLACSDNDTIVALNVTADRAYVGEAKLLRVVFSQEGQAPVSEEFPPPNSPVEGGGQQIEADVDRRIPLPDSWGEQETTVVVTAISPANTETATSEPVKFVLHPNETTAAFVDLKAPPEPPPPPAGGNGGAGGSAGDGSAGDGTAGEANGGASAGAGGATAGAAGTAEGGQLGTAGASAGSGGTAP